MNSSFPPAEPRKRNSLTTIGDEPPPAPPVAVPTSDTVVDPAELPMFSVALLLPAVVGANDTDTVVVAFAASVVVPGAPAANCVASVPVIANGVVSVSADEP